MIGKPTGIRITPAREPRLDDINGLIARSKTYWKWLEGYLKQAIDLLKVTPAYMRSHPCFEVLDAENNLVAFASVVVTDAKVVLDNLWVTPERIGQGIGRQACEYLSRLARERGWTPLWVLPDPYVEGFYVKLGFSDTGERVPSRVLGGPVFSWFRRSIKPAHRLP